MCGGSSVALLEGVRVDTSTPTGGTMTTMEQVVTKLQQELFTLRAQLCQDTPSLISLT